MKEPNICVIFVANIEKDMLLGDVCYEGGFLSDVIYHIDDTCPEIENFLPEDVYSNWLYQIQNICNLNDSINILYNSSNSSSAENFEIDFEIKQDEANEYLLGDAIKFHEGSLEIRSDIKEKLDWVANILNIGYYSFVIYTCPVAGGALGLFKILKSYGTFEEICNEENSILGYTACDVLEEALFSQTLFSAGGKLSKIMHGPDPTFAQKLFLGGVEKVIRKTALSNGRVKSQDIKFAKPEDYVPNIAFVVVSESVEIVSSGLPVPLQILVYKTSAQISKQFTKEWIDGNHSPDYKSSLKKGTMVTFCNMVLPGFKTEIGKAHLYGYCLSGAGHLLS